MTNAHEEFPPAVVARIWERVNKHGPLPENAPHLGPCWLWTAGLWPSGYGRIKVGNTNRRVHRVTYKLLVGPIPEGLELDHLCRVLTCVNPAHLEAVTHRENVLRGEGLAAKQARQTECLRGHDLTDPANLIPHTYGARQCRACRNFLRQQRKVQRSK